MITSSSSRDNSFSNSRVYVGITKKTHAMRGALTSVGFVAC